MDLSPFVLMILLEWKEANMLALPMPSKEVCVRVAADVSAELPQRGFTRKVFCVDRREPSEDRTRVIR